MTLTAFVLNQVFGLLLSAIGIPGKPTPHSAFNANLGAGMLRGICRVKRKLPSVRQVFWCEACVRDCRPVIIPDSRVSVAAAAEVACVEIIASPAP
jgi:hypothetical protein